MISTSYLHNQTILRALEFALAKGGFGKDTNQKRAAGSLIRQLKSNRSVSGRHEQLMSLLKVGTGMAEMIRATGISRRTVFRYLNHFEEAGVKITISDGKYRSE